MVTSGAVYAGRRVFVTGHTGFKGAWLSRWLVRCGAEVTGYALEPPTDPSLFRALRLRNDVRHIVADVRDHERLAGAMVEARPEVVFHLAAQPLVRESYSAPRPTFDTNVMGTVNVLEAARRSASVSAVVIVTSDKCYRNVRDGRPHLEDDPLGGLDPYSSSKGCAELVTGSYAASFFAEGSCAVASARAGNVIGGGDWAADRIVPDCVRALAAGEPVQVRNPDAVRPWQHVLEPLAGYLRLGESLLGEGHEFAGPWNFGPSPGDQGLTVRWVVERFLAEWGCGSWAAAGDQSAAPGEAAQLNLDSGKASARLGWVPSWGAAEAVRRTAAWYRSYYERPASALDLVDEDLRVYERGGVLAGRDEAEASR